MYALLLTFLVFAAPGCVYRFGLSNRSLPGGYSHIAIPVFKNKSMEVGVEPMFTNALIRRFERSEVAQVTNSDTAPVTLEGTILRIDTVSGAAINSGQLPTLPQDAVMTSDYRLVVAAEIMLKRKSDDRIIWQGRFSNEKGYSAPRIGTPLVNSANATYNHSARMNALASLAEDMMAEAHDRITENY